MKKKMERIKIHKLWTAGGASSHKALTKGVNDIMDYLEELAGKIENKEDIK